MTATFDLISEQVLTSAASSVTFSSIPQGFKDLVLECVLSATTTGPHNAGLRFNGDTSNSYSRTFLFGNGLTAGSGRQSNAGSYDGVAFIGTSWAVSITHLFNYSSSSVNKTALTRAGAGNALNVDANVGLWRNTNAITLIEVPVTFGGGSFAVGSTFRLYGIVG